MSAATALSSLKQQRPEWQPWLAVIEETLRDADAAVWNAAVPDGITAGPTTVPLLAGASLSVNTRVVRTLLQRLLDAAVRTGTAPMTSLRATLDSDPDVLSLFKASLCQDSTAIRHEAESTGADPEAYEAVIGLLCVPFLQACNRQMAPSMFASWVEGYCCVCGSWPTFAESRGIERRRFFRCGRCGSEWHARPLRCPYCGMDDHHALVSLVPEDSRVNAVIEGCQSRRGYVKTFTRLQGCQPGMVMLDDLASVHLDVAALDEGYRRPPGTGYALDVTVTAVAQKRRFFRWDA
jgi:FdhE protein